MFEHTIKHLNINKQKFWLRHDINIGIRDKGFRTIIINTFKNLKETMSIMSKQMENLREMDKLIVHWTRQGKNTIELENRPIETMQIEAQREHKFEKMNKASINGGGLLQKAP